ncbi:MAG: citrate transporter [Chloroflexi bacterium]|nr:MAG: citrate transporter [Chloroflexota bacterium]RLC83909.1 MAG: citrate transporter [Chloroflexota bacterium]
MIKQNLKRMSLVTILSLGLALVLLYNPPLLARAERSLADQGPVSLVGRVTDSQEEPVRDAEIVLIINGNREALLSTASQPDGAFMLDVPAEIVGDIETLTLEISRPHFASQVLEIESDDVAHLNRGESLRLPDLELARRITAGFWVATFTFVVILVIIALEKLHNAMAAMLGVAVILGTTFVGGAINPDLFIFDFEQALEYVNFDVIFLVTGMMIVIGVIEETGIFQWLAYQSYKLSGGRAWLLVTILMLITSVASALLDNVTTMLLMTPMTIQIAIALGVNPLTLLIPEVLASNIGGISTLIGTPTNILIGSYAGLAFTDFLTNLTPGVLLAQIALTVYVLVRYRAQFLGGESGLSEALLNRLRESGRITQPVKLRQSGIIFGVMLIFFIVGESIHLAPAVTATIGAVAMLLWVSPDIESMLKVVDWTTLMFFISLFIVVGAIQEVGLISIIAAAISRMVGGNLTAAILVLVWSAAFLSGIIANIPFTAAMLPVVGFLTRTIPGASNQVLFYALSIGAAMGGNSSLIGASANLVAAGIAERAGYRITYKEFFKAGMPAMIITVAIGTAWLFIRF